MVTRDTPGSKGPAMRTIDWRSDEVVILDQTALPFEERLLHLRTVDELVDAIRRLAVRGAMALGVAGALGIALAACRADESGVDLQAEVEAAATRLAKARPTAVNLSWGAERVLAVASGGRDAIVREALSVLEEDVVANREIGARGAALIDGRRTILTHCNAGALAGVEWGTALSIVRVLHERGAVAEVFVSETRPLLQGARLTSWELGRMGVPHRVVVDGAGAGLILSGRVDAVVVGADRIAMNGDVANKVGTVAHALAAKRAGIPFIVAAPESTIDPETARGSDITIEERDPDEILCFAGRRVAPERSSALNLAFDVTPADLVTAIVTQDRVIRPGVDPVVRPRD
jgi:methylthioribose-1-phosphate isomerase